jgi:egghead protein (zeste-white 4 protein)
VAVIDLRRPQDDQGDRDLLAAALEAQQGGGAAMVERLNLPDRALLELWARHGMSDQQLGDFLGIAPKDIARRRWQLIGQLELPLSTDGAAPVAAPRSSLRAQEPRPREQSRDLRLIAIVVLTLALAIGGMYFLQEVVWPRSARPEGALAITLATIGGFLWCCPILAGALSNVGMLLQRKDIEEPVGDPLPNLVSFRFMSRGTNPAALRSSVQSVHAVMAQYPLFAYVVEVCVETAQENLPADTIEMLMPEGYETPNGTLFKGRALQYAMEVSQIPDDAWIMHCDEESHIHESMLFGMYEAITEEERSGEHRIGQGAILYYNSLDDHPFLTLADSVRTGDDMGRFHLQNRCWHLPVWGFHGSFILVRSSVEKKVGFDFGPNGSITEDAFWALVSTENGARSRWVDGYMVEQGTERIVDFIKQRRRWYIGLLKVVLHAPVKLRLRLPLAFFTVLWSVSWLAVIYTYANYVVGWDTSPAVQALGNLSLATYVVIYTVGLRTNLRLYEVSFARKVRLYAMQVAFIPLFAILEAAGVLYAMVRPETGFHVVQKRMQSVDQPDGAVKAVPA